MTNRCPIVAAQEKGSPNFKRCQLPNTTSRSSTPPVGVMRRSCHERRIIRSARMSLDCVVDATYLFTANLGV